MGRRISLLCMYETREKERILDEEDWCIVTNKIPDTLLGVKLYSKPTWISGDQKYIINILISNKGTYVRNFACIAQTTDKISCIG